MLACRWRSGRRIARGIQARGHRRRSSCRKAAARGQTRGSHPIDGLLPADVEGFASLTELAPDLRWTWSHATDEVWRALDPVLWEQTHHPCDVLQTVSREKIRQVLADPAFRNKLDALVQSKKRSEETPTWFQRSHPSGGPV